MGVGQLFAIWTDNLIMAIRPIQNTAGLRAISGGRADEPPQTRWRLTPDGRCKESLWQALLSGVFYGVVAHSLFRITKPSEEERQELDMGVKSRIQAIARHVLDPITVLTGIGLFEFVRNRMVYDRSPTPTFLNPKLAFRNAFDHCIDRDVIDGKALIAQALQKYGGKNPLRRIQFEAIPWPEIRGNDGNGVTAKDVAITGAAIVVGALSAAAYVLGFRTVPAMEAAPAGFGLTTGDSPFISNQNHIY